jgi:hypothetical protein
MKMAELEAEMRQALANLTTEHAEELVGAGVPIFPIVIYQMVGVGRVRATESGCYCPDPAGGDAFISPVRVQYPDTPQSTEPWWFVRGGDLVDLLAWNPKEPECWALRVGAAAWLGCVAVQDYPELVAPPPTRVWRTPLSWFCADCDGLVVLSPERTDHYRILSELQGGIIAEDDHVREVQDIVERPWPAPRVWAASEVHTTE